MGSASNSDGPPESRAVVPAGSGAAWAPARGASAPTATSAASIRMGFMGVRSLRGRWWTARADPAPVVAGQTRGKRPAGRDMRVTVDVSCRVCSGELRPAVPGRLISLTPDALAPSRHEPAGHGYLLACLDCGAVQQPALPGRSELV